MRRMLILTIVAALAAAPSALAHVTITPTSVAPGADALLTVLVPNESKAAIVEVVVRPDPGFDYEGVQVPPGWRLRRQGKALVWSGGPLAPGELGTFALSGSAKSPTTLAFAVEEHYAGGGVTRYHPTVAVATPPAAGRDGASRTLGKAALAVGVAGTAVGVGAFFLALAVWLRGAPPDRDESLQEGKRESLVASPE